MRIVGPPDRQLAAWEQQIEDTTRQALRQVMDRIADRITGSLTAALIAHLPGKHDQATHGKGGGGAVRGSLASAKTTSEVNTAAAAEAKAITGRDIAFDLDGDPQIAREHAEGVLQGLERLPDAPLTRVSMSGDVRNGFAHTVSEPGGLSIEFNAHYATMSPDDYRAQIAQVGSRVPRMGDKAVFKAPSHVAIHEFGHVASMGHGLDDSNRDLAERFSAKAIADGTHHSYRQVVSEQVSIYAASNSLELSAEAFADVMINGGSSSELSRQIFDNIGRSYS